MTGHTSSWRRGALAAASFAVVALGCSSLERPRGGDGYFDAGSWTSAVAVYEERLDRGEDADDLRLRLALARAAPGHTASDLDRAVQVLEELQGSPRYAGHAAALLVIAERQLWLEEELIRARQERRATQARLEEEAAWVEALMTSLESSQLRAAALEERLQRQRAEAERLRRELEELKRIDLGPAR